MAIKTRKNPKTNKAEYKVRYYFYREGKKRDSETGWFDTVEQAIAEAQRLKIAKEDSDKASSLQRRDKLLISAFNEFIEYYKERANRETTDNTTTDCSIWRRARTIRSKYIPKNFSKIQIKEIDEVVFRDWLTYINSKDLSGNYVRSLRSTLGIFNQWLRDNGYYADRNLDLSIDYALSRTKIVKKNYKNRVDSRERNIITIAEIERICNYFYDKGIEDFKNFYYYTLFYFMFFSGLRVEEVVALQWKFIDFEKNDIEIKNAITERELRKNVYKRIEEEKYRTKNPTSNRIIHMFKFYYELMLDYKSSYKYYYNLPNKELQECFVFPSLLGKHPHEYQAGDRMNYMLHEAIDKLGMKNTDCQMMRHSCAMFLVSPPPEGLGYKEEEVIEHFGHTDAEMLKTVYARIDKYAKSKRLRTTFNEYLQEIDALEQTEEDNAQTRLLERFKGDNPEAEEKREERIFKQIDYAIKKKQYWYYYMPKDQKIINKYIKKNKKKAEQIHFFKEDILLPSVW